MPLHRFAGTSRWNEHRDDRAHGRLQNSLAQNDVRAGEPSRRWEARWNKWKGQATKGKTKKPTARREAADETTSSERLTALVEESDALARIVAKNPSAPVSLLRVLSRSEDEATRKNVILNPFTPYDVLSELENQFTELFVNNPALESYNSMRL